MPQRRDAEAAEVAERSDARRARLAALSGATIGAAIEVHRELGPGLLESAYQSALAHELKLRNVPFRQQVDVPVSYKGQTLAQGFRVDMLIDEQLVLELKSVEALAPIHKAQVLSYLRLLGLPLGLLINFNVPMLKAGIKRIANDL